MAAATAQLAAAPAPPRLRDEPIDTAVKVVTPENIAFEYQAAGPFRRVGAFLIDTAIRWMALFLLWMLFNLLTAVIGFFTSSAEFAGQVFLVLQGVFAVVVFVAEFFGSGVQEAYWGGQTLGKFLVGVRAVTVDGEPINGIQAVMRNLLRWADMYPLAPLTVFGLWLYDFFDLLQIPMAQGSLEGLYFVPTFLAGFAAMSLTRRCQRLGDLVCGTMVVVESRKWLFGVARLEDPRTPMLAALIPVDYEVSRSLARALALYAERRRHFTPQRRREIARHLGEPLIREFGLPPDTSHDLLLCALYYRSYVSDQGDDEGARRALEGLPPAPPANPFDPAVGSGPAGASLPQTRLVRGTELGGGGRG